MCLLACFLKKHPTDKTVLTREDVPATGDESGQYFLPEEGAHLAYLKADNTAASAKVLQALSSVAYGGVSTGAVEHHEFGKASGCTDACMEDLFKVSRCLS